MAAASTPASRNASNAATVRTSNCVTGPKAAGRAAVVEKERVRLAGALADRDEVAARLADLERS